LSNSEHQTPLVQPFGTLKIAKRTLPLLIVSISVPTKTRAPLTATSRYLPSVIRSARRAFLPWIVIEVLRCGTGRLFRFLTAICQIPLQCNQTYAKSISNNFWVCKAKWTEKQFDESCCAPHRDLTRDWLANKDNGGWI
jgi:hypothetical protein